MSPQSVAGAPPAFNSNAVRSGRPRIYFPNVTIEFFNSPPDRLRRYNNNYMKIPPPAQHRQTFMPRLIALSLLALLLAMAGAGCKTKATAELNPAGIYTLISVNGQNVPGSLTHECVVMLVKSGSLTLNADGTGRSMMVFAVPPHPDARREVKATYTQTGTELTLRWQGAGTTKGRLQGSQFTMNNEGIVFVYRK